MDRPPRDPKEPIISREMWWGIGVQAILITCATLGAFLMGLYVFPGSLDAHKISAAQTFALTTLVLSELLRAFTSRSERVGLFRLGLASNRSMLWAFGSSLAILLAIIYVPVLDPVFHTTFLGWRHWLMLLPLALLASVGAEITKAVLSILDARRLKAA
jgi:Ca2+-transporting ATPase